MKKLLTILLAVSLIAFLIGCSEAGNSGSDDESMSNVTGVTVAQDEEEGGLKVSWDEMDGADSYTVYVAESEEGEFELTERLFGYKLTNSYTYDDGATGTTYYFKVIWNNGDDTSALDAAEVVSAEYPEPLPGVKSISISASEELVVNGLPLDFTFNLEGDTSKVDSIKFYTKLSGDTEFIEYHSPLNIEKSSDGTEFTLDYNLPYNNGEVQDGEEVSFKAEAYDANDNKLNSVTKDHTAEFFVSTKTVEAECTGTNEITVYFTGCSLADYYEFDVQYPSDNSYLYRFVVSESDLSTATKDDLGTGTDYPYIYEYTITTTNPVPPAQSIIDEPHEVTVYPSKSSNVQDLTEGGGVPAEFYNY